MFISNSLFHGQLRTWAKIATPTLPLPIRERPCGGTWPGIWLLFLLAQTLGVTSLGFAAEEATCDWQRWEQSIARFMAQDLQRPPQHQQALFVGSSSIRMWELSKYFPEQRTINRGFGGSQICDSTHFIEVLVLKHHPRIVVLYAGDNDIASGKNAEQVALDFRAFVESIHKRQAGVKIVFIAIKPSIARWRLAKTMQQANALIAAECEKNPRLKFVDIWQPMLDPTGLPRKELFRRDGLHLSHAGYQVWTQLVGPHVTRQP